MQWDSFQRREDWNGAATLSSVNSSFLCMLLSYTFANRPLFEKRNIQHFPWLSPIYMHPGHLCSLPKERHMIVKKREKVF